MEESIMNWTTINFLSFLLHNTMWQRQAITALQELDEKYQRPDSVTITKQWSENWMYKWELMVLSRIGERSNLEITYDMTHGYVRVLWDTDKIPTYEPWVHKRRDNFIKKFRVKKQRPWWPQVWDIWHLDGWDIVFHDGNGGYDIYPHDNEYFDDVE